MGPAILRATRIYGRRSVMGIRGWLSTLPHVREIYACGIRNPINFFFVKSGIAAQGIRNPANDWNPESKFG